MAISLLVTLKSTQACFLPRILQISSSNEPLFPCSECKGAKAKCDHLEKCSECTIYQIEKILRCEHCCKNLLGSYPEPCGADCNRNNITQNISAKCDACSGPLRKKCKGCKKNSEFLSAKTNLKKHVKIFITSIQTIKGSSVRPCSHCRLCIKCKLTLTKGHRERAICSPCKSNSPVRCDSPPQKIIQMDTFPMHNHLQYHQYQQHHQQRPNPCSLNFILNDRPPQQEPMRLPALKRQLPSFDSLLNKESSSNPPKRQRPNIVTPQLIDMMTTKTPFPSLPHRLH